MKRSYELTSRDLRRLRELGQPISVTARLHQEKSEPIRDSTLIAINMPEPLGYEPVESRAIAATRVIKRLQSRHAFWTRKALLEEVVTLLMVGAGPKDTERAVRSLVSKTINQLLRSGELLVCEDAK
jgi:hypothetical protein